MPSSSVAAGRRPELQWPDLPAQQGISFDPFAETAIGSRIETNEKTTRRHKIVLKDTLRVLCFVVDIECCD
jgi:hypothetical protein